ncbi:MAG TPA: BCCT family transporter, partial [Tianweitania sediminis]|nr:BCCT family transporter [Tianweitania sediminis]
TVETPIWQRIYWCSLEGAVAALLLLAGGLTALQTMTLISALPFTVILLLLAFGLVRGMRADVARVVEHRQAQPAIPRRDATWQARLGSILHEPTEAEVLRFLDNVVRPALTDVCRELSKRGADASVSHDEDKGVALTVLAEGTRNFLYRVSPVHQLAMAFSAADAARPDARRRQIWSARTSFSDGSRGYDVMGFSKDDVLADVLAQFERYQILTNARSTSLYAASPDPD